MIKFNENRPIYIQIIERVKADIICGKIRGGDKMPSVREFSETFKVNPNTVQRVFTELEREGITYSKRGVGTFVSEEEGFLEKLQSIQAHDFTHRFVDEMIAMGFTKNQIIESIHQVFQKKI